MHNFPADLTWRVSSSSAGGNCVEVARSQTAVYVRDTKNRGQGVLPFSVPAWKEFLEAVRSGQHHL
jgi:Domain of unknown function (DUF397)